MMAAREDELHVSHWSRRGSAGALAGFAVLFSVAVPGAVAPASTKIFIGAVLLAVAALSLRGMKMGVWTEGDQLVSQGFLAVRRYNASDITDVGIMGRGTESEVVLTLSGGATARLTGATPAVWAPHRMEALADLVVELKAWLRSLPS